MDLVLRARSRYATYALVRQAMQAAVQAVRHDPDADAYLRAVFDEAAARERHYADLLRRLESGDMAHVDDVRWRVEERDACLERQYLRRGQCPLCGDDVLIDQYRMPDGTCVCVRGCVDCGLAFEDTGL